MSVAGCRAGYETGRASSMVLTPGDGPGMVMLGDGRKGVLI